eukprot:g4575.t1
MDRPSPLDDSRLLGGLQKSLEEQLAPLRQGLEQKASASDESLRLLGKVLEQSRDAESTMKQRLEAVEARLDRMGHEPAFMPMTRHTRLLLISGCRHDGSCCRPPLDRVAYFQSLHVQQTGRRLANGCEERTSSELRTEPRTAWTEQDEGCEFLQSSKVTVTGCSSHEQAWAIQNLLIEWFPRGVKLFFKIQSSAKKLEVLVNEKVLVSKAVSKLLEDDIAGLWPTDRAKIKAEIRGWLDDSPDEQQQAPSEKDPSVREKTGSSALEIVGSISVILSDEPQPTNIYLADPKPLLRRIP